MKKKLIFLDIDGTLTPAGSNTPPESAMRAVKRAQARGHKVFLCTGRNPAMLSPVLALGFDGAVAGAGGYVFAGEKVLFDCPMTAEQLETGMRLLRENGVFRTIEAKDATWGDEDLGDFLAQAGEGNSELVRWRKALAEQLNILPMREYDGRPVYKIVFMCKTASQLEPARQALEKDFNFVVQDVAAYQCLNGELINRRFDKGRGVRIVAEHFGLPLEDTIGFGDSMNDLEMIQTVGCSVCMDNGSPKLKEISDLICPAVENDGLYWGFEKLGLI
ncbi:MAG: Cof-type HAD-IIB family hydrolase [Clostridiales bacterium]|nr:Cof-type HAD-IIB family hydrolase [Clostridiales bacterium]